MKRRSFITGLAATATVGGLPRVADTQAIPPAPPVDIPITVTPGSGGGSIIPASRMTDWTQPGMTSRGGIPNRTTIYTTLSPLGGTTDDNTQISNAIAAAPDNTVIQLTAGVFRINGGPGWLICLINRSNITLRGVGPGTGSSKGNGGVFVADPTATQLYFYNFSQASSAAVVLNTVDPMQNIVNYDLAQDAVLNTKTITLATTPPFTVGQLLLIDQNTDNHPDVYWGDCHDPPGGQSRSLESRQDRSLSQIIMVAGINGNTITTETPLHCTFSPTYSAQVMSFNPDSHTIQNVGIEELYIYGGNSGHIAMNNCAYCWVKHVEGHWCNGNSLSISHGYRIEIRDSFFHETPNPNPDGSYIIDLRNSTSDCLLENNISWYADKCIVMRCTGGGNVVAYNYMDDAFGAGFPQLPETGLNAEHMTTSHMELFEGNYSHNYCSGDFWGNDVDITIFRNQLSGIRAASPSLNTFTSGGLPYIDIGNPRFAAGVHSHCWRQNFVGNILGKQGQVLLSVNIPGVIVAAQTSWAYEQISQLSPAGQVPMWYIGAEQDTNCLAPPNNVWTFQPTTYQTTLRQGNWDWYTQLQRWHGIGGSGPTDSSSPQTIPNSLYLTSAPAFFKTNTWPWVDPSTGTTYTLPAKARFDSGNYNTI